MPLRVADYRALAKAFREVSDGLSIRSEDQRAYQALQQAGRNVAAYCKDHNNNFDIHRFMDEANLNG